MNCRSVGYPMFDYNPGGLLMQGRNFTGNGTYRYGFNGKENDNEARGEGVQQNYGLRIYDTRLTRFQSVDPLEKDYPWYSPYHFAGNNPIEFIDLDGAEPLKPRTTRYYASLTVTTGETGIKGTIFGIPFSFDYSMENSLELEVKSYFDLSLGGNINLGLSFTRRQIESGFKGKIGQLGGEEGRSKEIINYINTDDGYGKYSEESFKSDESISYGPVSTRTKDRISFGVNFNAFVAGAGVEVGAEQNSEMTTKSIPVKKETIQPKCATPIEKKSNNTNKVSSYSVTVTD